MSSRSLRAAANPPAAGAARPIVVKLGGSVVRSGELAAWLDAIAGARVPIVVVPGGGALADEVRACQSRLGFGDAAAHRMALLAMDQLAWAVAGLRQGFTVGASEAELRDALEAGNVAVWAPYAAIAGRADIESSWRLTSDSLAVWLAARIGAARCYLIKSIASPKASRLSARQLARDGVVDEAFADMLAETGTPTVLLGRGDKDSFVASAAEGQPCGAEIA
jgi:aspartokinase-like uncharacterized kinase